MAQEWLRVVPRRAQEYRPQVQTAQLQALIDSCMEHKLWALQQLDRCHSFDAHFLKQMQSEQAQLLKQLRWTHPSVTAGASSTTCLFCKLRRRAGGFASCCKKCAETGGMDHSKHCLGYRPAQGYLPEADQISQDVAFLVHGVMEEHSLRLVTHNDKNVHEDVQSKHVPCLTGIRSSASSAASSSASSATSGTEPCLLYTSPSPRDRG